MTTVLSHDPRKKAWKGKRFERNKFGAVGVKDPEHGFFHSKGEHKRFYVLLQRQRSGEIKNLKRQVKYQLNVNGLTVCAIIMDFTYDELIHDSPNGVGKLWEFVDEDHKGYQTPESILQHKLFEAIFGRKIRLS